MDGREEVDGYGTLPNAGNHVTRGEQRQHGLLARGDADEDYEIDPVKYNWHVCMQRGCNNLQDYYKRHAEPAVVTEDTYVPTRKK